MKPLLLCAMPFGYGPAAKMLCIAEQARRHGATVDFVGHGPAHELASRSAPLFRRVLHARAEEPAARALVRDSAGLLAVMDRDFAQLAAENGVPLYVVDSLLWMRDRVPQPFAGARRYFAQRFPGLPEILLRLRPDATVVGPIVPVPPPSVPEGRRGLLVNLGGCDSPLAPDHEQRVARFVLRALIGSALMDAFPGAVTVMGGARCIERLEGEHRGNAVRFRSLSHDEAQGALASAATVLTCPGLTSSLECFRLRVPTYFLPPQNYSQWCILKTFRKAGLAPCSLHWEDLSPDHGLRERMPEEQRNPEVRETVAKLTTSDAASRLLRERLDSCVESDGDALAAEQKRFFDSLGTNGAAEIAATVVARAEV